MEREAEGQGLVLSLVLSTRRGDAKRGKKQGRVRLMTVEWWIQIHARTDGLTHALTHTYRGLTRGRCREPGAWGCGCNRCVALRLSYLLVHSVPVR